MTNPFPSVLRMTILACQGNPGPAGAGASFDPRGGTIGGEAGNTLVLSDDDAVAAQHAALHVEHGEWRLTNLSRQTAIAVNGRPLAPGDHAPLREGDIVNLAAYVLRASFEQVVPGWNAPLPDALRDVQQVVDFMGNPVAATTVTASVATMPASTASASASFASGDMPWTHGAGTPPAPSLHLSRMTPELSVAATHAADGLLSDGASDLLDQPVDPLALFGTSDEPWAHHGEPAGDALLDNWPDDVAPSRANRLDEHPYASSHASMRDALPAFQGHLRLGAVSAPLEPLEPLEPPEPLRPLEPLESPEPLEPPEPSVIPQRVGFDSLPDLDALADSTSSAAPLATGIAPAPESAPTTAFADTSGHPGATARSASRTAPAATPFGFGTAFGATARQVYTPASRLAHPGFVPHVGPLNAGGNTGNAGNATIVRVPPAPPVESQHQVRAAGQNDPFDAIPTLGDPLTYASPHLTQLAQAFLDGAGIAATDANAAGFTPDYMRGLGALARGLKLLMPER